MFAPTRSHVAEQQIRAGVYPDALDPSYMELTHKDFGAVLAEYPGPSLKGDRDTANVPVHETFQTISERGLDSLIQDN